VTIILTTITAMIAFMVGNDDPLPVEIMITQTLQAIPEQWFPYVMAFISVFGYQPWGAMLVIICVILIALRVDQRLGIYFAVVASVQGLINQALKMVIARPRPSEPLVRVFLPTDGYSFPSGHVMFYIVCFGVLVYILLSNGKRTFLKYTAITFLAGLILTVGVSRIYLGAHWLMDVLAGYSAGAILLTWTIEIMRRWVNVRTPNAANTHQGATK
jgi:membrane-associated phospholipid phosphatase